MPKDQAKFVLCTGYDFMPGRHSLHRNVPLARAVDEDVLLVHTWEGKPLPREHGGPCRMITPKLYAWKGAKWIRKIEFLAEEKKGFWEVRGYSNSASPGSTIGIRRSGMGTTCPMDELAANRRLSCPAWSPLSRNSTPMPLTTPICCLGAQIRRFPRHPKRLRRLQPPSP